MLFDNWFNKMEGCNSRLERAYDELVLDRYNDNYTFWKTVLCWLKSVYNEGYEEAKKENLSIIQSLKIEIKTQRKEIGLLREERRLLVDKNKVQEIGCKQ